MSAASALAEPPAGSKGAADEAAVVLPDADPDQLLKLMENALQVTPPDESVEGRRRAMAKAFRTILAGADKVLAHPKATDAQKEEARQFQISTYYQAARMRFPGYADKLRELAAALRAAGAKPEVRALATFLGIKADFATSEGLSPKAIARVADFVKEFPGDEAAIGLLEEIGMTAELLGEAAEAKKAYAMVLEKFPDHGATKQAAGSLRRLELVGKPLDLAGVLADGSPAEIGKFRGKVVLVDFWATWCGPCVDEMAHLRKLHEKYTDQGFEIVGIPLDEHRPTVDEFLKEEKLPWPQFFAASKPSGDPEAMARHSSVERYGIGAIPVMFLVDRDGVVLATNLRGDQLDEKLAEAFAKSPVRPASADERTKR